jgi:hypothetical protein
MQALGRYKATVNESETITEAQKFSSACRRPGRQHAEGLTFPVTSRVERS